MSICSGHTNEADVEQMNKIYANSMCTIERTTSRHMKKLALIFTLIPFVLVGQINFESSWDIALSKAEENEKYIFLNATTDWCEPCNEMIEYTFTDLEVANFFNKNFINVNMDMEAYPGVDLAEQFTIGVFPSMLFIDTKGNIVHRGCGAMDAGQLLLLGEEALNDTTTLRYMEERYDGGDRSVDFMLGYLNLLEESCLDAEKFATNYLSEIVLSDLSKETPWEVFSSYQWDIFSREFQYLLVNQKKFEEAIGGKFVNAKLYDTYLSQYQEVFESEELHDFGMRALLHSIGEVTFIGSDTLKLMMNLHYAEFKENWDDYAAHAIELVGMMEDNDPEQLNELAWKFYLFIDNPNQLKIASSWAQQAVDQLSDPSVIDTYASLLYKLGEKNKAVELEKQALALANEMNEDTSHYEHQLKKFENK